MVIKNPNNIDIPEYLNEEFFVAALEEGLREIKIAVHEISFEWATKPGDNYCSRIYRVSVAYERYVVDQEQSMREQIRLIVKTIPINEDMRFLADVGVFLKEKQTYLDILPRLEILVDGQKFGAKCFYAVKAPIQTIVFNDLKVDGFTVASRQDQLDWAHSELILQNLGQLHATSMVLAKRDSEITKRFTLGMLCEETIIKSDKFFNLFGSTLKSLAINAENWPGFEKIAQKLHYLHANFKPICAHMADRRDNDRIIVMNHGDMWTTNFMFAYDDSRQPEKPTRSIFVDFQLNFYGSPGCDLNFLLNTSIRLNLIEDRREDLINAYYKSFSETLEFLHYDKIPTLEDLKFELRARELYGLFALFGFLPIVTMPTEWSEEKVADSMTDEELLQKKFQKLFAQERLQAQLKYSLKRLEYMGVLDEFYVKPSENGCV
uniref:CHK kinase-like domain-containing protein n=1 Tax=Ceratitis capitata TaxID=7213 RepID=W8C416_CERCA